MQKVEVERRFASSASPSPDGEPGELECELLYLAEDRHLLLVSLSALLADAMAPADLLRELATAYAADRQDGELPAEPRLQYADYAEWQHHLAAAEESTPGFAYWQRQDLSRLTSLRLPFEQELAGDLSFLPRTLSAVVPPPLAAAAAALARELEIEPSIVWLAAWAALLGRLCDNEEVVLGVLVDGRGVEALQQAQGLFARYLPVTAGISGERPFPELASGLAALLQEAEAWQELFSWQGPAFFPFCFDWEERMARREAAGVTFSLARLAAVIDRFRLRLTCVLAPDGLGLELSYDESRLGVADAERFAASLLALLAAAVAEPAVALDDLPALGPRERVQLLEEWNPAAAPWPEGETIHGLFEHQVALAPARPAVLWEGERLSYSDLDRRAGRLAHRLRQLAVGPERVVGVLLERSPEAVVAIFGILKAGGAYLPLDPAFPAERLAFMVKDAGVTALVSRRAVVSALAGGMALGSVPAVLFEEEEEWPAVDAAPMTGGAGPEHLAYIIYTSGSTGRPKGVAVTHRNLVGSTRARFAYYPQAVEAFLLISSLSFDSSVAGLFWSLCQGGALVPARERFQLDITLLVDSLARYEISHLLCLPSLYSLLLEQPGLLAASRHLRAVILAGEACVAPLVARHFECLPEVALYDEYGPTEATVWSSVYDCSELGTSQRVPIGRPIPGAQLYGLAGGGNPAPIGAPAELYVGGAGVARGYVGRPDVTAERFVPDPWGEAGGRLYRTGDRVRFRLDGILDFLGRTDHQVKIRGHRVEPDEVAAALATHPAIREAVVIAREVRPGERRLVAFVVAPEGMPGSGALRDFLAERLPEPMLPSVFVALEQMPLTPNGKVDRRALAAIEPSRSEVESEYVAPVTAAERALAEVWTEVLGVERVGTEDDFFRLGGDSILTIQVRTLAAELGLHFTVQEIFELRTVRALSERAAGREKPDVDVASIPPFGLLFPADRERLPEDAEDAYPIAALQWGMLYHDELHGQGMFRDITSFHLRIPFDPETLSYALHKLASAHPILRTSFHFSGYGEPLQIVHREVEIPLTVEDISRQTPSEQERIVRAWIESERLCPFNWARPPLLRMSIHRRSPGTLQFTISEHHAILDGWSMSSFLAELLQYYLCLLDNVEAAPPPAPVAQMRDLVALEQQALRDAGAEEFWRGRLDQAPSGLLAAWLRPAQGEPGEALEQQLIVVASSVVEGLRALADGTRVPLRSVLLAAHLRVISELTGNPFVLTGCVTHGRPEGQDGDRALGLFLNTIPFCLALDGGSWRDLVGQVYAADLALRPHRHYPMAHMRRWRREPLFETGFNFIDFHVMEAVQGLPTVALLGLRTWEDTDLHLFANFIPFDGGAGLRLLLNTHGSEVGGDQAKTIGGLYRQTLETMATDPWAPHQDFAPDLPARPTGALEPPAAMAVPLQASRSYVAPRNPTEEALTTIWCEVLGLNQVSVDGDFLSLGGHSLAALQIFLKIQERLETPLALSDVIEAPTVSRLAETIVAMSRT